MASAMTTTTFNENFQYSHLQEFVLPLDSRRVLSRRSSGASEASVRSNLSGVSISSSTSTDSGMGSGDGILKGLTILGVCLVYAFALFFIASLTAALSYVFKFNIKGSTHPVKKGSSSRKEKKTKAPSQVPKPFDQQG